MAPIDTSLTAKQQTVLTFIERYQMKYGSSPTLREIREHLKVSSDNSVLKHIDALERKGYMKRDNTPRGIHLLQCVKERLDSPDVTLPLLGLIPAGNPTSVEENTEDRVSIATTMVRNPRSSFMLRVQGDSMIDAGIHDGDMVVVDSKKQPRHGDIVVGLIDGENTVKRFIQKGTGTFLKAENPAYADLYPANELLIQGVVTAVMRTYA